MQEKEIDFFTRSKENIQALAQKVDKRPFFKLAFLTVALGCTIGLGIHLSSIGFHYYQHLSEIKANNQKNAVNIDIEQIKKITPEEFSDFTHYLKNNENIQNF